RTDTVFDEAVPVFHPADPDILFGAQESLHPEAPVADGVLGVQGQANLLSLAVVNHPFAPGHVEPVPVESQAAKREFGLGAGRGRGVEGNPSVIREVDFHPAMRVAAAHDVESATSLYSPRRK